MLGLIGHVETVQTPAGEMHRVRLGPYATASELEQAKQKLGGGGVPAVAIRVK
jgi:cell division septation protein DedD